MKGIDSRKAFRYTDCSDKHKSEDVDLLHYLD